MFNSWIFLHRYFLIIQSWLQSSYIKEEFLWLLPFYMVVATYSCYEKVGRTMRTAIVSNLLNWLWKHVKKVRSSQPAILVLNWIKQFFPVSIVKDKSLFIDLTTENSIKAIYVNLSYTELPFLNRIRSGNKKYFWLRNWKNRNYCKRFGRKCFYSCR